MGDSSNLYSVVLRKSHYKSHMLQSNQSSSMPNIIDESDMIDSGGREIVTIIAQLVSLEYL